MSHVCTQCKAPRVWRVQPFRLPDWHSRFGAPLVPVATVHALDDDHSQHAEPHRFSAAHFEVRICDACGFTAWYARGLDTLRALGTRLAATGREDVTLLTGTER